MHVPKIYKVEDPQIIARFIRENGFGTLVTGGESYPTGTHLPMELETNAEGKEILSAHMSKANPQWKLFADHPKVTAVFLSDINQYISSSWYDHPNVPTWNYISVHVAGTIKLLDPKGTWNSLKRLTDRYEQNSANPVDFEKLPPAVQAEISGVVAFEIKIEQLDAVCKMSQNRDDKNYKNIILELRKRGDRKSVLVAEIMEGMRHV